MAARRPPGRPKFEDTLTPAEWRVVEDVRHGLTGPRIAARQGVSVDAVKYHVKNALQKLGLPDRRALRMWDGVARASALHGKDGAMTGDTRLGPIHQLARTVTDIAEAQRWYGEVLGLPPLFAFQGMAFFDCGGMRLYLQEAKTASPESILYFKVADVRSAHADLAARGVVFTTAPHLVHRHPDGSEEWLAIFNDPDGRPLAIMARIDP